MTYGNETDWARMNHCLGHRCEGIGSDRDEGMYGPSLLKSFAPEGVYSGREHTPGHRKIEQIGLG